MYADLSRLFGKGAVFMDTRGGSVHWGEDGDKALKDGLENCEVLVALIGPQWTSCEGSFGIRALDAADDWVRNEIATSLRSQGRALGSGAGSDREPLSGWQRPEVEPAVAELELERATPHDLRRTCLTWITRLGFGRDAMDRIANHRKGGVTDVYDRHGYADGDRRIMAALARHVLSVVEGKQTSNVVSLR